MAAQLAHELNQPLSALRTYTRAADRLVSAESPDLPRARQAMADAVAQADRAGAIIRRLREFVKKREVAAVPAEARALAAEAIALVAPEAARRGITIALEAPAGAPRVRADAVQIAQVLVNLLRNAIDATAAASRHTIVVRTEPRAGYAEIAVRDAGSGVPAELRTRLFEPFASTKPEGMGLGLSISRSIVEAHGGRLWLEASGPDGTEFRFTLPYVETAP
jgi:two-component system sensor kinase FixL